MALSASALEVSFFSVAPVAKCSRRRTFGYVSTYRTSLLCQRKLSIDALAPLTCIHPHSFQASLSHSRSLSVPSPIPTLPSCFSLSFSLASSLSLSLLLPLSLVFLYALPPAEKGAFALNTHVHGVEESPIGLRLSTHVYILYL